MNPWEPDKMADKPVDPATIRLRQPSKPPAVYTAPPETAQAEAVFRAQYATHWAAHHERRAVGERAAAEAAKAEAIRAAQLAAMPLVVTTPRPKPKRSWLRQVMEKYL